MNAFFEGMILGLTLTVLAGPVFFALIQTGINEGFRMGWALAIGVLLCDAIYLYLAFLGINSVKVSPQMETIFSIAGGLVLLGFGLKMIFDPLPKKGSHTKSGKRHHGYLRKFFNGILINGINPFVVLFWLSIAGIASVRFKSDVNANLLFFGGILVTVHSTDILKIYLSKRLRELLTSRLIIILNRIAGIAFVGFSLRLFYFGFTSASIGLNP